MAPTLEVCVDNFESVAATVEGGVSRIELCSSLLDGGLTPSTGFLKLIKKTFPKLTVFPMIRPRGGDFCYSLEEIQIMENDIQALKELGADGFVFGCLSRDGSIDIESNQTLLKQAGSLPCTFHRAFDMVDNIEESLEEVIHLGFSRILTSGQWPTAIEGLEQIKKLVSLASNRIIIMPGSGVNTENLSTILSSCQVREFHSSASDKRQSDMTCRNTAISMGANSSDFSWKVSTKNKVCQLIEISKSF